MGIDPRTAIDSVHLTIADLSRSIRFYEERVGLKLLGREPGLARLGIGAGVGVGAGETAGEATLLTLHESPSAPRTRGTTGLYHFAILVPSRVDLSHALRRLVATRTLMQGFADHGVSEALYLADPDGNGIEIYRDRPRPEWPVSNGQIQLVTEPLDVERLLADSEGAEPRSSLPPATVMGHIHLHVSKLEDAEHFYRDTLGFDLIMRYGRSASFLSAGGYHHHVAINTWAGEGAPAPPAGAIGLRHAVIRVSSAQALEAVAASLEAAAAGFTRGEGEWKGRSIDTSDPAGNGLRIIY
jgi:catechol 2,3-dioxygenase